jgi:hypothetical protein
MIYLGSRYQNTQVRYLLDGRTGKTRASILRYRPAQDYVVSSTTWRVGLRLDRVASGLYDDASEWWRIMDANDDIIDPMSLAPGMTVRVP